MNCNLAVPSEKHPESKKHYPTREGRLLGQSWLLKSSKKPDEEELTPALAHAHLVGSESRILRMRDILKKTHYQ